MISTFTIKNSENTTDGSVGGTDIQMDTTHEITSIHHRQPVVPMQGMLSGQSTIEMCVVSFLRRLQNESTPCGNSDRQS